MAVWNYTGRADIDRRLVSLSVDDKASPLKAYLRADPSLKANPKFAGCSVVLEAFLRTKAERADLGPLAALAPSVEVVFREFLLAEDVRFRLKVVNPADRRIAGVLDDIRGREPRPPKDDPRKRKTLLPVNWATDADNLGERFWKVSFAGPRPTLLLRRGKFVTLGDADGPAFRALAFPAVLREVLSRAYIVQFRTEPPWREDWEKLVFLLDGTRPPAPPRDDRDAPALEAYFAEVSDWIDAVCARFAKDCRLGRIDANFKRV